MHQRVEYSPGIFAVADEASARSIILTPERELTTDERWSRETPYLAAWAEREFNLSRNSVLLDFGCGLGRLAKEMIARTGCRVVGVDISPSMRALAISYVNSERFIACGPDMLIWLRARGLRFDAALAVWVLQHCARPDADIKIIAGALRDGGQLFVVNEQRRVLPTRQGWVDDQQNVRAMLEAAFAQSRFEKLEPLAVSQEVSDRTFAAICIKAR